MKPTNDPIHDEAIKIVVIGIIAYCALFLACWIHG